MKKRFSFGWVLSVLIMSCVLTAGFEFAKGMVMSSAEAADSGSFGDIDSDGRITMKDAMIIAQYYNKNFVQFETVEWSELIQKSTDTTPIDTTPTETTTTEINYTGLWKREIPITTVSGDSGTTYTTPAPASGMRIITAGELDDLCSSVPLPVVKQYYSVDSLDFKSLYPDILNAVVQNNSNDDIKNMVIAFFAWDKNNLPVLLKSSSGLFGSYQKNISYSGINLVPGGTYGESNGFGVTTGLGIITFRSIVVSYETFDGTTWENPYLDYFVEMYSGKKLTQNMYIEVPI